MKNWLSEQAKTNLFQGQVLSDLSVSMKPNIDPTMDANEK